MIAKLLGAEHDTTFGKVVRRELHGDLVTRKDADVVHAHLPRDMAKNHMPVFKLDPKRGIREILDDLSLHFNDIFLGHGSASRETGPLEIGLFQKTLILVRHYICLNLRHEIHRHHNNNQ